jgi:hypothetical protein
LQTQQDRGWKRIRGTKSKRVISDCELEWKRKQPVQKPSFSGNPGTITNSDTTEYSSHSPDISDLFQQWHIQNSMWQTNRYTTQQINKNKQDGPLGTKALFEQWKPVTRHIKIFLQP